jgi:hypothetical protein
MKGFLAVVAAASFVVLLSPVSGNHLQVESGKAIAFDHKESGAGEWWVEAILSGSSASSVSGVSAMDYGGPWVAMKKTSYGSWSASFHIEPGNPVKFRAAWADGVQVTSCWFSHPQGVEACGGPDPTPPPPSGSWTNGGTFATVPGGIWQMGIGDADRDGTPELYGVGYQSLYRFTHVTATSATTEVMGGGFSYLVVGDGDRDGKPELYANAYNPNKNGYDMHQFTRVNGAWVDKVVASSGWLLSGPFTLGDIDRSGTRELYVAGNDDNGFNTITKLWFANGVWNTAVLARFQDPSGDTLSPGSIWAGDADGDGQSELVMTESGRPGSFIYMVDYTGGAWVATRVYSGYTSVGMVVAGDADHDGHGEIAFLGYETGPTVDLLKFSNGVWTHSTAATLPSGGEALVLGDGDNDGAQELYILATDHHAYQLRKASSSAWVLADMGTTPSFDDFGDGIIVGDADGDGKREVYTATEYYNYQVGDYTHLTQFKWVPSGSPPPPGFDATFTGVKGNEWWVQASVSGNQAIAGVDARLDCGGSWIALTKQSYGWAKSIHVLSGQKVDFRAHSSTGATDLSGGYIWPNATPTSAC